MLALTLLVALGTVETVCVYFTRRPGSGLTSAAHLLLLAAMAAMLVVPAQVRGIAVLVGVILLAAAADRLIRRKASPICGGQLIACSVATLAVLGAMASVPGRSAPMPGMGTTMPGMGAGSAIDGGALGGHLPAVTAAVVLAVFLARAAVELSRAVRVRRFTDAVPIAHVAAVAGALSMVVMCTAMVAV